MDFQTDLPNALSGLKNMNIGKEIPRTGILKVNFNCPRFRELSHSGRYAHNNVLQIPESGSSYQLVCNGASIVNSGSS